MLIAAETIKWEGREGGEAQEAIRDIRSRVETTLGCWCRIRLPWCYQMHLIVIRQGGRSREAQMRMTEFALARLGRYRFEKTCLDAGCPA